MAAAEESDSGLDDLLLELAVHFLGDREVAGQIRDERDSDPGKISNVQPCKRISLDLLDAACLSAASDEPIPIGSGEFWLRQISGGRPVTFGESERVVDQDGMRRLGAARYRDDDEADYER
ncbi:MAG: hypothetical protein ACRDTE_31825 [Pseudonocardiaceae bacterium]